MGSETDLIVIYGLLSTLSILSFFKKKFIIIIIAF